jgi:hypothetical protein
MAVLQILKGLLMAGDGALQLLDILGSALTESCLSLSIPLLSLL